MQRHPPGHELPPQVMQTAMLQKTLRPRCHIVCSCHQHLCAERLVRVPRHVQGWTFFHRRGHTHHHVRWHRRCYLCPAVVLQGALLQTCITLQKIGRMPVAEVGHKAALTKYLPACLGPGAQACRSCGENDQAMSPMHRRRHERPASATQFWVHDPLALDQQCRMRLRQDKPCSPLSKNGTCSHIRRQHQMTKSWLGTCLCLCTGKVLQAHLQSAEYQYANACRSCPCWWSLWP